MFLRTEFKIFFVLLLQGNNLPMYEKKHTYENKSTTMKNLLLP